VESRESDLEAEASEPDSGAHSVVRYTPVEELARGGLCVVTLALARSGRGFERLVALKELTGAGAGDSDLAEELRTEGQLAARLRHPHVVSVLDVGEGQRGPFLVLEYVEGGGLYDLAWMASRRGLGLDVGLAVRLVMDALEGLAHAHGHSGEHGPEPVIHRDVSLRNVLVGNDGVAKIGDFGLARAKSRVGNTHPHTVKGTLGYMSPEQMRGEPLSVSTDVYGMGAVLWEVLVGRSLFSWSTSLIDAQRRASRGAPAPSTYRRDLPPALDAVCLKALAREPEHRYGSAGEMCDALERASREFPPLPSRREIAFWVNELLGARIASRRAKVAEVRRARGAAAPHVDATRGCRWP
jgi:serine/threonine-protein kinase